MNFAAESVYTGANLYAPGVLKIVNADKGDIVRVISPQNHTVGYGKLILDKHEIYSNKKGIAVEIIKSVFSIPKLRELKIFNQGYIYDQSYPSILVGYILNPKPGEKILDMCAAPGGKTTHLSQLMDNKGTILACDRSKNRLKVLQQHADRLGIVNIKILRVDSITLPQKYTIKFDKILLDPPCTALGHRPKLYGEHQIKDVIALSKYQMQLINAASKMLKPGGKLLYSTCTIPIYENENIIKYAVENLNLKVIKQQCYPGSLGEVLNSDMYLQNCQRFYPHLHDTPGFFIALLKKNS
ncbi:MAG: methyltransferase domain-containing protein [Candidatus Odinarchaeia archaeon]